MESARRMRHRAAAIACAIGLAAASFFAGPATFAQEGADLNPGPATPFPAGPAMPPEVSDYASDWPVAQGNLAATRDAAESPIDSSNVDQLEVAWTVPIDAEYQWGGMTAPSIIAGDRIYLQDMQSNVFAVDRDTGEVIWEQRYDQPTPGPNGLALAYGMIFGPLGNNAGVFGLNAETGDEIWQVRLSNHRSVGTTMAPTVYDNIVYIGTTPGTTEIYYQGGGKGELFALDALTGATLWQFDTTGGAGGNLWGMPRINSGGGVWYPLSIDDEGNLYFGVGNPAPWPGIDSELGTFPNASSRPEPNDYTNSVVSLDPDTGAIRWYHNARPLDLFDLDFQNTPVITNLEIDGEERKVVFGSGKTGTVIAYDGDSGEVLWETAVGIHENDDLTEIPEGETVRVYPGSLGGVETPIAYADGTVFAPIVNRWSSYTATTQEEAQPFNEATGELVALNAVDGSITWQVDLPQMALGGATVANDLVFTGTMDGTVRAFDVETGEEVWVEQTTAGINAPLAIAGDLLIVPAGAPLLNPPEGVEPRAQVIAYRLGGAEATPVAGDEGS